MANTCLRALLVIGAAVTLPVLSVSAASNLDVGQAANCAAAMKIKRDELPPGVRDALIYSKAADWFSRVGRDESPADYGKIEADYKKKLLSEKSNGRASFGKAVDGCRTYYETSSGDT
ncbi:MAG: hypothetical protein CMK09_02260 [Ponticaulis sp.]|nr:hypothetical protein [Ponticaulis sp.]